jgi:hypothetical protein
MAFEHVKNYSEVTKVSVKLSRGDNEIVKIRATKFDEILQKEVYLSLDVRHAITKSYNYDIKHLLTSI